MLLIIKTKIRDRNLSGLSCESGKRTGPISLVTPTSDVMPYTPLGGETLNVWFDRSPQFLSRGMEDREDLIGADRSIDKVRNKIEVHFNIT